MIENVNRKGENKGDLYLSERIRTQDRNWLNPPTRNMTKADEKGEKQEEKRKKEVAPAAGRL